MNHFYQFREWIWTQRWAPLHDQEGSEHDSCSLHVHRKKAPEHQQQVCSLLEGRRCPKRVPKKVPQFFFIGKELSRSSQDEHVIKVKCTRIKKSSSFISLFWPSWSPCTACTYQDQLQFFSRNIFRFFTFWRQFSILIPKTYDWSQRIWWPKKSNQTFSRAMYKHYQTASKVVTSTARDFRSCVSTLIHIIGYFMFNLLLRSSQVSSL